MKKLTEAFNILAKKLPSYIRRGKDFKKLRKLEILCMKLLNENLKMEMNYTIKQTLFRIYMENKGSNY